MSMGQTMLSAAFLVLLTIAVMNANKMIVDRDTAHYESEALEQAGYLANSLLSEISRKKFDDNADTSLSYMQPVTDFTTSGSLGPDVYYCQNGFLNYESWLVSLPDKYPYQSVKSEIVYTTSPLHSHYGYNDIDDYNGYYRIDETNVYTLDTLRVKVYYVIPDSTKDLGYIRTTTRTYFKKIDVSVLNRRYLKDTLFYSTIISY